MGAIEHLSITISADLAERLRGRVAIGEYNSLDEVVAEALREFEVEHDHTTEPAFVAWFKREVAPAIERYDADPSRGLTIDQVHERLALARAKREHSRC